MRIVITGSKGFIGQVVLKKLKSTKSVEITEFDRHTQNILDLESLKSFVQNQDAIIHLAGVNRGTNQQLVEVNTLGTLSLLDAVVKYSPTTRIVFASSFQVYLPQSLYGLSKRFAEDLLVQYGLSHNIQSVILRLSNIYGPGGRPFYNSVIATFAHLINSGESLKINGDGSQERDYIYVDDAADAFVKALFCKQQSQTEVVDVCSGMSTSLNEIIQTIRSVNEKKFEVVYNKAPKETPWPTKDKNPQKAKKLLGWEPEVKLKEGLRKVVQSQE